MKKVLIILLYGGLITVIKAAFEPIPFNPKYDHFQSSSNHTIKITGNHFNPYNISTLKYNQFILEIDFKSNKFLIEINSFGESLYSENHYSTHFITSTKLIYQTIIGFNHYQIHIKNYGFANLKSVDFGLKFQLLNELNALLLFQNILKDKSNKIQNEINSNLLEQVLKN